MKARGGETMHDEIAEAVVLSEVMVAIAAAWSQDAGRSPNAPGEAKPVEGENSKGRKL